MRSIDWIFSWCAMALLMAATSLTLNASIPRASYLSAQISKVADEENSSSLPVVEQDVSTEALCATAPLRETIRQSGNEEIRQFSNYLTDQVGTVLRIVKEDGTVVNQYDYDAFGRVRQASPNTFATVENRYLFQGREWDKHGGFYYFRNRIYLPERGEFATPDMNLGRGILGELDGMATLTFCGGDPVNCIDPTGLAFEIDIPGFFNPVMMNDFRKEPLPSEFVEQQAYMNRAVMGASTVAVAGPVVSLAAAEIVPAVAGAYPAAVGAYNGACGMTWTLYIEPWAAPAYAAAQAWIAKSLLRTAVVTYFGVTVTGKKGNVQPPARPWYSTSANPQSGKVINPLSQVNTVPASSPSSPITVAPSQGLGVNLNKSLTGTDGVSVGNQLVREEVITIKKGEFVNRVFDSRAGQVGSKVSGPLGRSFSPGSGVPTTDTEAIKQRGLNVFYPNNAKEAIIFRSRNDIPAIKRISIGGTEVELLIESKYLNELEKIRQFSLSAGTP
jgi:RHS repeat-associated protein